MCSFSGRNVHKMDSEDSKKCKNPWETANPLSLLTFAWVWPIFKKGLRKDLELEDLYDTPRAHESERLATELSRYVNLLQICNNTNLYGQYLCIFLDCGKKKGKMRRGLGTTCSIVPCSDSLESTLSTTVYVLALMK